jgi:hypothetical protein
MMFTMPQGGVSGLVIGTVFKIVERQDLSLAGSIPVRLRLTSPLVLLASAFPLVLLACAVAN